MGRMPKTHYEETILHARKLISEHGGEEVMDPYKIYAAIGRGARPDSEGVFPSTHQSDLSMLNSHEKSMANALMGRSDLVQSACMGIYNEMGRKTFYISPGLTMELSDTECLGEGRFLEPPYPCAYYCLGAPVYHICGKDTFRTWKDQIAGYYLFKTIHHKSKTPILSIVAMGKFSGTGSAYVNFNLPLSVLRQNLLVNRELCINTARQLNHPDVEENANIIELALNILFYINSESAEISGPKTNHIPKPKSSKKKKIRAYEAEVELMSSTEYIELGKSIKVIKSVPVTSQTSRSGKSFSYKYRFTVRGHFRNQPCGKDRQEIKRIFIRPYMKGPEAADIVHKKYSMGKEG